MDSLDLQVLTQARQWIADGRGVWLATVVETWGSAPRPPGALLALRDDGTLAGSVSGGCIEDDLIERVRQGERVQRPTVLGYGVTKEEAARFGLPCGGTLRLLQERLADADWIGEVLERTAAHELVARELDLASGRSRIRPARRGERFGYDGRCLTTLFGPRWRLLLIGAGPLSRLLAGMALALDFEVICCDPREAYRPGWDVPGSRFSTDMPDDLLLRLEPDPHTAVVALSHDPKLDDMALLEALKSPAFYVGALGSRRNSAKRRERLALFDLGAADIARLHSPVGLDIGADTPAEIAVSILADLVAVRHGRHLNTVNTAAADPASLSPSPESLAP